MIVGNINNLQGKKVESSEVKNTLMKVLISPKEGWNGYVMRVVEVEEGGYTPKHQHPWIHINYVIEGVGEIFIDGVANKVSAGSFAQVPKDVIHQYKNTGKEVFKFICIVPEEGHIFYD